MVRAASSLQTLRWQKQRPRLIEVKLTPPILELAREDVLRVHSLQPLEYGVRRYGADRYHARRNAGALHALEDARRTEGFAGRGNRLSGGDCQSDNADWTPPRKPHTAELDAAAFSCPASSILP